MKKKSSDNEQVGLGGRLHAILDNTVDGIITINEHGLIEAYNKACCNLFGYTPEDVIGKNIKILMPRP